MAESGARAVMAALADPSREGPAALFVGGCVRDTLLGREVKDVDIATVHAPDEVTARLDAAGIGYHTAGIDHGTVAAHADGRVYEVTTLRVDVETDGRRATVAYTDDWAADAARRDFTMNALYMDAGGRVFDPLGGIDDLRARRVRFIGDADERIREDALRIMRFYRFHAQLHEPDEPAARDLDADGLAACRRNREMLARLSGERVRDELFKLLLAPGAIGMLDGPTYPELFAWLLPELPDLRGSFGLTAMAVTERDVEDSPDALRRLVTLIEAFPHRTPDDLPAMHSDAAAICERLRLSRKQRERLSTMLDRPRDLEPRWPVDDDDLEWDHASAMLPVPRMLAWRRRLKRDRAIDRSYRPYLHALDDEAWRDAVLLNRADQLARMMAADEGEPARFNPEQQWLDLLALPAREPRPEFPLRGTDAIELGVPEGPDVRRLLDEVEAWWIDGGLAAGRKACLRELRRRASG
ncbi:MAG: CCA tRNA nucleotidyltransferase [Alphaproteobacteria bacterium]|nr:CCA tRNA nucleotidyltransferase [Alphaproteobacteria bacterium]